MEGLARAARLAREEANRAVLQGSMATCSPQELLFQLLQIAQQLLLVATRKHSPRQILQKMMHHIGPAPVSSELRIGQLQREDGCTYVNFRQPQLRWPWCCELPCSHPPTQSP